MTSLDPPIRLCIANGDNIEAKFRIRFPIKLGQIVINLNALVVPDDIGGIDILFGSTDLRDTRARLDFAEQRIYFRKGYQSHMKLSQEVLLEPQCTRTVRSHGKVPKLFKNRDMVIKSTGIGKRTMVTRSLVNLNKNGCYVVLMNDSRTQLKFKRVLEWLILT